jgi:hypothetical protein
LFKPTQTAASDSDPDAFTARINGRRAHGIGYSEPEKY